ncbi:Protein of unknown function (DUF971) [gamma proteobacterium HdN1]|nr:Protein of unknown function (DUF971) [gamma proteobacterium HdN1]
MTTLTDHNTTFSEAIPVEINLNREARTLELVYTNGERHTLSCEYLRVHSPSAEVRGHGHGEGVLQVGKKFVNINALEPIGNYAVKIAFDDGHDTGLFSWTYLLELGRQHETMWKIYLDRLTEAGAKREPNLIGRWKPNG